MTGPRTLLGRFTVTPPFPTFFQRNRRLRRKLPVVSPETRCPLPPRRDRSRIIGEQENTGKCFFHSTLLCVELPDETSVKESALFFLGGGTIVKKVIDACYDRGIPFFGENGF